MSCFWGFDRAVGVWFIGGSRKAWDVFKAAILVVSRLEAS